MVHRPRRWPFWALTTLLLALAVTAGTANAAWATFKTTKAGSTTTSAHGMVTPSQPSCSVLGVGSVRLSWPAPSDAGQTDVYGSGNLVAGYEVGKSTSSSGPFTFVDSGTSTTYSAGALGVGTYYYVVRSYKNSWRSASSTPRAVQVTLVLTTCL